MFPAPHRAGLIEAQAGLEHALEAATGFRLLTEPASLKLGNIGGGWKVVRAFPAPHRAGLIEAARTRWATTPSPRTSFRLLTEPASLKPVRPPGPSRGAVQWFPAPHRAGLIEAVKPGRRANPISAVSGSSQSRPH